MALTPLFKPEEDTEMRAWAPCPEFMPANGSRICSLREDHQGNCWAIVDLWTDKFHAPSSSARLRVTDDSIELAMRARWLDHEKPPLPEGEAPVLYVQEWEEYSGLVLPDIESMRNALYAVKLPFYPKKISLTDHF